MIDRELTTIDEDVLLNKLVCLIFNVYWYIGTNLCIFHYTSLLNNIKVPVYMFRYTCTVYVYQYSTDDRWFDLLKVLWKCYSMIISMSFISGNEKYILHTVVSIFA